MTVLLNENTSDDLWRGFNDLHVDFPESGSEKLNPIKFTRKYKLYLISHFVNRIVTLDDKFELPTNSVLHVLDDVYHVNDHSDTPRISENELITRESWRKFIYHAKDFNLSGPIEIAEKYIYLQAGLPVSLMKFRTEQGSNFRYLPSLDKIPTSVNFLTVVNHNPLFRVRLLGANQYFRKIQLILTSILNTVEQIVPHEKQQFILIPWSNEIFDRSSFIRSRTKLTKQTVKFNESFHYIVMMHLVNYMWNSAETSIFKKLSPEALAQTNLVLQAKDKYFIFNLADIAKFNAKNRVYFKFCNQLNLLSVLGYPECYSEEQTNSILNESEVEQEEVKSDDTAETAVVNSVNVKEDNDEQLESAITVAAKEADTSPETSDTEEVKVANIVTKVADVVKSAVASKPVGTFAIHSVSPKTGKTVEIKIAKEDDEDTVSEVTPEQYCTVVTRQASDFIENTELPPKSKEHFKKLANTYKTLTLGGVRLDKILTEDSDVSLDIEDSKLDKETLQLHVDDESAVENSLTVFDKEYMTKTYKKDLVNTLISFQKNGVYLTGLKEVKNVTDLNSTTTYTASYTDINGKRSSCKFTVPNVGRDGKIIVDGVKQVLKKQRINLPIVKINEVEVSLASNQNKTRVIRNTAKAHSFFSTVADLIKKAEGKIQVTFGNYKGTERLPYEYTSIAERYKSITFVTQDKEHQQIVLCFDYPHRAETFDGNETSLFKLESELGVFVGYAGRDALFIDADNKLNANSPMTGNISFRYDHLLELMLSATDLPTSRIRTTEWVNIKILDKLIPVVTLLCYKHGLRKTLNLLNAKYTITEGRSKTIVSGNEGIYPDALTNADNLNDTVDDLPTVIEVDAISGNETLMGSAYIPKATDIPIVFADKVLWINRYPLKHSLILAGLANYDLKSYDLASMETKDVYYSILQDSGLSTNYLKGINSFFDLFVDGMTFEVLKSMKMPTNVTGLLIKSAEMLSTTDYRNPSSRVNHRIRGFEQFNAVIYNEMARQFAAYQSGRGAANAFSVNPDAIYLRIIQNQSMLPAETPNPIQDLKDQAGMTYAGIGGRTSESFVVEDRKYSEDDLGVISEATVDNGKVGINAQLSFNPNINTTTGLLGDSTDSTIDSGKIFSAAVALFPFATQDDAKRMNFISIQSAHMVPVVKADLNRVRTGYERVVAHRVGREFACTASNQGKVTDVDSKAKTIEVTYKDGSIDVYQYGEVYSEVQSFEVTQDLVPTVTLGQKVNKGDILAYNKGFFRLDPKSKQLDFSIGVKANVALIETDTTLEDSQEISERLSEKLAFEPVNTRCVMLSKGTNILSFRSVGDAVLNTDELMVFDEGGDDSSDIFNKVDSETLDLLTDLNKRTPKAKYNGVIARIDAYTSCPLEEMSTTVASLFKSANVDKNKRARTAKGTLAQDEFNPASIIPKGSKYKGYDFSGDEVLFVFHIKEKLNHKAGDKLVLCNQLKATTAQVMPKPTYTESGVEVDMFFSASAISRRIVLSPFLHGITSRILERVQEEFIKIAESEDK